MGGVVSSATVGVANRGGSEPRYGRGVAIRGCNEPCYGRGVATRGYSEPRYGRGAAMRGCTFEPKPFVTDGAPQLRSYPTIAPLRTR